MASTPGLGLFLGVGGLVDGLWGLGNPSRILLRSQICVSEGVERELERVWRGDTLNTRLTTYGEIQERSRRRYVQQGRLREDRTRKIA